MISKLKRYAFIIVLPLLISCDDRYEEADFSTALPPFDEIHLNSVFDVYLISDSIYSIKIAGDERTIKNISFKVENRALSITNNSKVKWLTPDDNKVSVYITSNQLRGIFISETCKIETLNPLVSDDLSVVIHPAPKLSHINLELDCGNFLYWNNFQCGGKLTLRGSVTNLALYSFALMSIEANSLVANNALIENNSKGDCEVWVSDKIEYSIRNIGNIYLHGKPGEIVLGERTSTGQLIQVD